MRAVILLHPDPDFYSKTIHRIVKELYSNNNSTIPVKFEAINAKVLLFITDKLMKTSACSSF